MGYAKAVKRLDFPDLSEDDDPIWIEIRNPKTLPLSELTPEGDLMVDEAGHPVDKGAATMATFGILAKLVTKWNVYDGTSGDEAAFPVPATAEHISKLPWDIQQRLMEEVTAVTSVPL